MVYILILTMVNSLSGVKILIPFPSFASSTSNGDMDDESTICSLPPSGDMDDVSTNFSSSLSSDLLSDC